MNDQQGAMTLIFTQDVKQEVGWVVLKCHCQEMFSKRNLISSNVHHVCMHISLSKSKPFFTNFSLFFSVILLRIFDI